MPAAPNRTLVRFARVMLQPGEQRRLTFDLDGKALSTVDAAGRRSVEAGQATVWVGGGLPGAQTAGVGLKVNVKGRRSLPQF
jgi:beta-glucosidase